MRKLNKVVVSCAVTGSVHTPTMSPALPVEPEDIVAQGLDAAAGAAILHLHARTPWRGSRERPTCSGSPPIPYKGQP